MQLIKKTQAGKQCIKVCPSLSKIESLHVTTPSIKSPLHLSCLSELAMLLRTKALGTICQCRTHAQMIS